MDLGVCKPFGEIRMEDADLEVQLHIQCGDQHVIRYAYWHWGPCNRWRGSDTGFATIFPEDVVTANETDEQTPSRALILDGNAADCLRNCSNMRRGAYSVVTCRRISGLEKEIYEHP